MAQHKWHKEIKAWADGAEIEAKHTLQNGTREWFLNSNPLWNDDNWEYRIKPQPKEEPYWLCCGCKDPRHNKSCLEAKMGHPERCRFGTASEHFKPQPKEPQYLYAWLNKEDETVSITEVFNPNGILEDNLFKYIGKIPLITENDNGND